MIINKKLKLIALACSLIVAGSAFAQNSASADFNAKPATNNNTGSASLPQLGTVNANTGAVTLNSPVTPAVVKVAPTSVPVTSVGLEKHNPNASLASKAKAVPLKAAAPKPLTYEKGDGPLFVNPEVAVKNTPQQSVSLPGVMKTPGADLALDFNRTRIIEMGSADNPTVYLSATDVNRVSLPYSPRVISGEGIETKISGNNFYVNFKEGVTNSVQVYLENPQGAGVLGLQLVPKKIQAQTVVVQDTQPNGGNALKELKGNDYSTNLQGVMETLALGASPQGFSRQKLDIPTIIKNGLAIDAKDKFSGSDKDIFVYQVSNPLPETVNIREKDFDSGSVLAISIYPKPLLRSGEVAKVFVIARKPAASN